MAILARVCFRLIYSPRVVQYLMSCVHNERVISQREGRRQKAASQTSVRRQLSLRRQLHVDVTCQQRLECRLMKKLTYCIK